MTKYPTFSAMDVDVVRPPWTRGKLPARTDKVTVAPGCAAMDSAYEAPFSVGVDSGAVEREIEALAEKIEEATRRDRGVVVSEKGDGGEMVTI